jgi:pyridinium-3,5-bisthiocarboxylic acid mononucleotide nickel chelatase
MFCTLKSVKKLEKDNVKLLEANLDDMNPQVYEYLLERLFENGALDAYLTPIIMKKSRPAIKVSIICTQKDVQKLSKIIFEETTTIGIRILDASRLKLSRKIVKVKTKYGELSVKISESEGIRKITPEYGECRQIAKQKKVPLIDVISSARESAKKL